MATSSARGFARVDLITVLVCLGCLAIVAAGFLFPAARYGPRAESTNCRHNQKNIGLAFRIYATDNNDLFPFGTPTAATNWTNAASAFRHFRALSNELSHPNLLICAADKKTKPAPTFASLSNPNLSYFVGLVPDTANPSLLLAGDNTLTLSNRPLRGLELTLQTNVSLRWTSTTHKDFGNVTVADGSVQQFSASRLHEAITQGATNTLLLP